MKTYVRRTHVILFFVIASSLCVGWYARGVAFDLNVERAAKSIVREMDGTLVPELGVIVHSSEGYERKAEIDGQSAAEATRRIEFFRRLRNDPEYVNRFVPASKR